MAEIPIERKPRRNLMGWFIGIIVVLLVLAAVWYFWLYLPGTRPSPTESSYGVQQPVAVAPAPRRP